MVYLLSLRFEDDAGFDTHRRRLERGVFYSRPQDRRSDHFPAHCISIDANCRTLVTIPSCEPITQRRSATDREGQS